MLASYANEEGGMVYPAIAERLVFTKGLTFTWLSIVTPSYVMSLTD